MEHLLPDAAQRGEPALSAQERVEVLQGGLEIAVFEGACLVDWLRREEPETECLPRAPQPRRRAQGRD